MGVRRTALTLLRVNQKDGFDCPGCAWPEGDKRHTAEFCENGAKAVTDEATLRTVGRDFFAAHPIAAIMHFAGSIVVPDSVTDPQILAAHRWLSAREGVFVEPASAASVAGLLQAHEQGLLDVGLTVVCTVTGHGLKDPQWALKNADGSDVAPVKVSADAYSVARELGLQG